MRKRATLVALSAVILTYAVNASASPQGIQEVAIKLITERLADSSGIKGSPDRRKWVENNYECALRIIRALDSQSIIDLAGLPEISQKYPTWDRLRKDRLFQLGYEECIHKENLFPASNTEVQRLGINAGIYNSSWFAAYYIRKAASITK